MLPTPTNNFFSLLACFNQVGEVEVWRISASKFCFKGKRMAKGRRTQIVSLLRTGELSCLVQERWWHRAELAESFVAVDGTKRAAKRAGG